MDNASSASSLHALSRGIANLVRDASRSVVGIHSHRSRASGFAWRAGLIVTAEEAITDDERIDVVLPGGERVRATLRGRDPTTDIALLRVEGADVTPMPLASDAVETGALGVVVGSDDGTPVAALAIVARSGPAWRSLRGGNVDARIELDARMRAAAEGGLAFDAAGRALGMAVFGPRRRVLVIPSATIERVASKLDADGRIARGYLGLGLQAVTVDGDGVAAMVMSVDAAGPGAAAGIRQGDVIVRWSGKAVEGVNAILRELGPDSVGTVVTLSATRGGEPIAFSVTVGARPDR